MPEHHLTFRSRVPESADSVYEWHARDGSFERLTPPWGHVRVVEARGTIAPGDGKRLRVGFGPAGFDWDIEHHEPLQGIGFRDVQTKGPFTNWHHEHEFIPDSDTSSIVEDRIRYVLPMGSAGERLGNGLVRNKLDDVFRYRHGLLASDLAWHQRHEPVAPLRIAVTGASGMVGTQLVAFLQTGGHEVFRLVRGENSGPNEIAWDPARGEIDRAALEGMDAVIHLAGVSIAGGLWTANRKRAILESRVSSTSLLAKTLASLNRPPAVLVSMSAVGYYGSAPGEILTEESPNGTGFLAEVCEAWENAAAPAREAGIRVVHPRLGVVLSGAGGILPLVARAVSLGGGGSFGDGGQYMSWIGIDDVLGVLLEAIRNDRLRGPVNAVSPEAVTNAEFTKTLARVLRRPAVLNVPGRILRTIAGELADELLLVDQAAKPDRLQQEGFPFAWSELETTLRYQLGKFGKNRTAFADENDIPDRDHGSLTADG